MRPLKIDIDPADIDADGLADGNASTGATVTLDGALTSGGTFTSADGLGRQICIKDNSTVDQSGATFTITGTDADGRAQVEAVTGPGSGATVESTKYFKTVTSIAITSPASACTVDIGTVDEFATKTYVVPSRNETPHTVQLEVTGTISLDLQVTVQDPFVNDPSPFDHDDQEDLAWIVDANHDNKTASQLNKLAFCGVRAFRIIANSYTNGAEIQAHIVLFE